jgi:hypothetical protein
MLLHCLLQLMSAAAAADKMSPVENGNPVAMVITSF